MLTLDLEIASEKVQELMAFSNEAKIFLNFTNYDVQRLNRIYEKIKPMIPHIVSYVVKSISTNRHLVDILEKHPLSVEEATSVFNSWLEKVLTWKYQEDFVKEAYRIGAAHAKAGVNVKYMTLTMGTFITGTNYVLARMIKDAETVRVYSLSLQKAMMLNLTLMIQYYEDIRREQAEKTIDQLVQNIKS